MKVKIFSLAAVTTMALMAFLGASTAAATVLFGGETKLESGATIHGTLTSGTSAQLTTTAGGAIDTCTESTVQATTANTGKSGEAVSAAVNSLTWGGCSLTTDTLTNGSLSINWTAGTNGTISGAGSVVTVNTGVSCRYGTGGGTHLGTVTGKKSPTIDINAVVNEQEPKHFLCPDTARWTASYTVTSPAGFNVADEALKVAVELIVPEIKEGKTVEFTAKNTGDVKWTIINERQFTPDPGEWNPINAGCEPSTLLPGESCAWIVACVKAGPVTWELKVRDENKATDEKVVETKCT